MKRVTANGVKYEITIIGEVDENTPVLIYNHGWGQRHWPHANTDGDYSFFGNWVENGSPGVDNAIIITYDRYANRLSNGQQNVIGANQILEEVINEYGVSAANCTFSGFSDGGEPAVKQAADLCRMYENVQSPSIMLLDGNVNGRRGYDIFTDEDLKILGERNAVIYVVERSNVRPDISHHEKWASYGINVISVRDQYAQISGTTGNTHTNVNADYIGLGLIGFQLGQGIITTDEFKNNYEYYLPTTRYDVESGEWVPFDIRGMTNQEVYELLGINVFLDLTYGEKSDKLMTLENISISNMTRSLYYVRSDYELLEQRLNNIIDKLRNSTVAQETPNYMDYISSSSTVPKEIPILVQEYFGINANLMLSLNHDLYQFAKVGLSLNEIDDEVKNIAENL